MEEKVFFNQRGVTVTSARFIVPAQTFAMSGLTSVKVFRETPSRGGPILMLIVGVFSLLIAAAVSSGIMLMIGLLLAGLAVAILVNQAPSFHVLLHSSSGEAKALSSSDKAFIDQVVASLNNSIIHRG